MSYWSNYKPYVPAAKKKKIAKKKLATLRKKNPDIQPIVLEGRKLASSWWGKAWNKNLESYADYSNRIARGRAYVRNGSILDLKIMPGSIEALVQGSDTYKISIEIQALSKTTWQEIQSTCQGKLQSMQTLLEGKFSESLEEIFTNHKTGLFPSPSEICFRCNCPDWADMCKHIAAVLYGIAVRLDANPNLFFTLRDVKVDDLIAKVIKEKKLDFLNKAKKKTARVISDSNLESLFGIEIDKINPLVIPTKRKAKKGKIKSKKPQPNKSKKPTITKQTTRINKSQKTITPKNKNKKQATTPKNSQQRVLDLLSKKKSCSASDQEFAKKAKIGTSYLRVVLEKLVIQGYVKKQKQGQKVIFSILKK